MATTSSEKNNSPKSYYAFFDLDHTITGSVSGKELAVAAFKKGLMKRSDLATAIFLSFAHKTNLINPSRAIALMGKWVKGIRVGTMEDLCSDIFSNKIQPTVFPQVFDELKFHRENNAGLVILSSTLHPLCLKMEEFLKMDDVLCTELESVEGILTGNPRDTFCYGDEKLKRLRAYCEKNNSKTEDAWYYGDALADLPALSFSGHPVCINPERRLERIARKRGWQIYYWNRK